MNGFLKTYVVKPFLIGGVSIFLKEQYDSYRPNYFHSDVNYNFSTDNKPASQFTKDRIAASVKNIDFSDKSDFDDATKGFVYKEQSLKIKTEDGHTVLDPDANLKMLEKFKECPETVNPSTWRHAQLMSH
eukprot:Pgem_evm1s17930